MGDLAALVEFMVFVGCVGLAGWFRHKGPPRAARRMISVLIACVVSISLVNGVTEKNLWPFSSWGLARWVVGAEPDGTMEVWGLLVGVTRDGTEYEIDPHAFEPLNFHELTAWIRTNHNSSPSDVQLRVGQMILAMANRARQDALDGRRVGSLRRFLGPLAAPAHVILPAGWTDPGDVPTARFLEVRYYRSNWELGAATGQPVKTQTTLMYAFPATP